MFEAHWKSTLACAIALLLLVTCGGPDTTEPVDQAPIPTGKADSFHDLRRYDVLLTDPHCDVCSSDDKNHLLADSAIVAAVIELIDGAESTIDVAQFTFSQRPIEDALRRAHERGVRVRLAMNAAQAEGDNPSTRLRDAGLDVRFIEGKHNGTYAGLQHAKFMVVDTETIVAGSNNWSSTGVSINDENTIVVHSSAEDPFVAAFRCYFDRMFTQRVNEGPACSTEEVTFTPSSTPWKEIRREIREATTSIDVLMHHLVFRDAVKELARAAERGVKVRVIINAADRAETDGSDWDRLRAAGGEVRYKKTNGDLYQIMHHKLAIFDGRVLLNGSGNWSGSAFFNNWEFYVRYVDADVVDPFRELFRRLWDWSLSAASLDAGLTAREQDVATRPIYFGNLHAHVDLVDGTKRLDDGNLERDVDGERVDVSAEANGDPVRHALEYARDRGGLDFIALTPHVQDDDPSDADSIANMSPDAFDRLIATARQVNDESAGRFVALPGLEWSTNSTGNHVNVIGVEELSKVVRGDFATFYEGYLPLRREEGDAAWLMFNHPRTFRHHEEATNGNWDQIFGLPLTEIENNSERRKKFNDYGLDDYPPLRDVRDAWISGAELPDEEVVAETLATIAGVTSPYARLFEVTVARGTELGSETPQNPSLSVDPETETVERFVKVHSDWDYYLRHGFRTAPVANHDNHLANWGTGHTSRTALIAPALDERSLLAAIGERAVYASEDPDLEIRLYAEDRVRSGGELRTYGDSVSLQLYLHDPDFAGPFEVRVWGGIEGGHEVVPVVELGELAAGQWHRFEVDTTTVGTHFFYVEVLEREPNRMAWTAPIWVTRR